MKILRGFAAVTLGAGLGATAPIGGANAAQQFVIGVSNTHIGNSWREEFVCSIKAEALASGLVSKIVLANREAGPSEQIADLRTLISAGVNAIIINPSDARRSTASSSRRRTRESSSLRPTRPFQRSGSLYRDRRSVGYGQGRRRVAVRSAEGQGRHHRDARYRRSARRRRRRRVSTKPGRIIRASRSSRRLSWTGPTKKPRSRCRRCWPRASISTAYGHPASTTP